MVPPPKTNNLPNLRNPNQILSERKARLLKSMQLPASSLTKTASLIATIQSTIFIRWLRREFLQEGAQYLIPRSHKSTRSFMIIDPNLEIQRMMEISRCFRVPNFNVAYRGLLQHKSRALLQTLSPCLQY